MVELARVLKKPQGSIRVDCTFCSIKQLAILKLMDGREYPGSEVPERPKSEKAGEEGLASLARPADGFLNSGTSDPG